MNAIINKSDQVNSLQIGVMGEINNVPFSMRTGFLIKNDSDEPIELEVNLLGMDPAVYITTSFSPGWNPELIREVKSGDVSNIKYGY